ncbi:MAG: tRNA pseudouridine(55) synthase TruB [Melioribacteraceae bacterium]
MMTKKISNDYVPDFLEGEIILIDKPFRKTSFDVIYQIRRAVNVKKAGHAGTLDPLATGLLIVCTGKKTKEIPSFIGLNKTYTGIISLGKTTPSFDLETEFDSENEFEYVTDEMIFNVRNTFLGSTTQIPPMYSAVKKNGKALYKFARKGIEVERKPREIFISKFEINKIELPDIHFEITCSSGTYIRVIANDFGKKLGCGAYLKSLRRTQIGNYNVEDAFQLNEFLEFLKSNSFSVN